MFRPGWTGSLALLPLALLSVGCAARSGPDSATLEKRIAHLEQEVGEAKRLASEAQRNAESAALRADEAARTSEAIFAKRVSK